MKLTVIIPNYNNGKYLPECLESVLNQTFMPDEIIVADDASTDNSEKIISEYEKKYSQIRGIYRKHNVGVAINRHQAIIEANGEYFTTLDSDDFYYTNEKLENEMGLIETYRNQYSKEIVPFSNTILVNEKGEFLKELFSEKQEALQGNIFLSVLTRSGPIPLDYIMRKKDYISLGGYDSNLTIYEDWDFNIRASRQLEFYYTCDSGTAYRQHDKGLSSSPYLEHLNAFQLIFKRNFHLVDPSKQKTARRFFNEYLFTYYLNHVKLLTEDRQFLIDFLLDNEVVGPPKTSNQDILAKLDHIPCDSKVVLYGAGEHTEMLLRLTRETNVQFDYIVDRNERMQGKNMHGLSIRHPDHIFLTKPDYIVISSCSFQNQIKNFLRQIQFPGEVITLYGDDETVPFYSFGTNGR